MTRFLVVNGPNLDLLGTRQPEIYGTTTLADIEAMLRTVARGMRAVELEFFQSNSEGAIVDCLRDRRAAVRGLMINPGGLAHTSVVLRDAVAAMDVPTVEVHLTNIHAREPFRRRSLLAGVCRGTVCGLGPYGYRAALEALATWCGVAAGDAA